MHIVIDIPEDVIKGAKSSPNYYQAYHFEKIWRAIVNGTPLPKGHGRLVDENELLKMTKSYKSELGRLKADPFVKCGIETVENFIEEMSPIIEADKEEQNEKR
jgi:hypothetical protein